MIPISVVNAFEALPYNYMIPALRKFSLEELEETRQELLQFRDHTDRLRFVNVYNAINDILNDRVPEVMNLQ